MDISPFANWLSSHPKKWELGEGFTSVGTRFRVTGGKPILFHFWMAHGPPLPHPEG